MESHEPEAWARAVFAEFDDDAQRIYLLGIDPDTGRPEHGLVAYRLYLDESATPIRVPPQLVGTPITGSDLCTESDVHGAEAWSKAEGTCHHPMPGPTTR
ncbi:hypothetical protein LRS71_24475 [Rhodococcus pyridinivorans]|uniref:hypothetical protein n=1 Tax=Rhodococcus pyridinivorans TaxID=103816 RepID=UPI001E5B8A89|nr:hypothetical protein [Rhodococcus pyridinivorans]MCD5422670.1 hypothetical protein [Rhodococcus pyridinivorans]